MWSFGDRCRRFMGGFLDDVWSTMKTMKRRVILALAVGVAAGAAGCGDSPPGRTFYQRNIEPILQQKCAGNTSGCHSTNASDPFQFAAGNLDVTSFENVQKRRDLLGSFGAYAYPLFLIKAVPTGALRLSYNDYNPGDTRAVGGFRPLEIQHSGGPILDANSDAFFLLQNWLENGATENGLPPATPAQVGDGACSNSLPPGFTKADYVTPLTQAAFETYKAQVQPILTEHGCSAGSCHGAPQSDFYITCGEGEDELAFNFSQAWSFVNDPVEDSQLLRVPLAVGAGGRGHTGGDQFASTSDAEYDTIRTWADAIGKLEFAKGDAGKIFFAQNIQPLLLLRGCASEACHSPAATNDFKLRSGTQGFFSAVALEKNYELLKNEFMALEFADARRSRAVAKGLLAAYPGTDAVAGIAHRGGSVLETEGQPPDPALCGVFNPLTSSAFCTFQEWLDRERAALGADVTDMTAGKTIPIVYVERAAGSASADRLDFDAFHGGADVRVVTATFGAASTITSTDVGGPTSLSAGCPGLSPA
ncbi:MAG: hypothetical protein IAG13_39085, partial [Deltaproteobacteria bacterium]|nr:hypothetical protein [Nannocystaceae bacterium]